MDKKDLKELQRIREQVARIAIDLDDVKNVSEIAFHVRRLRKLDEEIEQFIQGSGTGDN